MHDVLVEKAEWTISLGRLAVNGDVIFKAKYVNKVPLFQNRYQSPSLGNNVMKHGFP
jgi:hypothetical protein